MDLAIHLSALCVCIALTEMKGDTLRPRVRSGGEEQWFTAESPPVSEVFLPPEGQALKSLSFFSSWLSDQTIWCVARDGSSGGSAD